jgi:hypothetical protein
MIVKVIGKIFVELIRYGINFPQFAYALWKLSFLRQPVITIFGGKHAARESSYFFHAYELGKYLAQRHISVITGGGPGVMEAALCGALTEKSASAHVLGIGVSHVDEEFHPSCKSKTVFVRDFAARKWLLIHYSIAFVVFPGGIGTVDELFEVLNLIKTKKIKPAPVIVVGSSYWRPLLQLLDSAIKEGFILEKYRSLITVVDTNEQIITILEEYLKKKYQI